MAAALNPQLTAMLAALDVVQPGLGNELVSQQTDDGGPSQLRNRQRPRTDEVAASHAVSMANWTARDHRRGHQSC